MPTSLVPEISVYFHHKCKINFFIKKQERVKSTNYNLSQEKIEFLMIKHTDFAEMKEAIKHTQYLHSAFNLSTAYTMREKNFSTFSSVFCIFIFISCFTILYSRAKGLNMEKFQHIDYAGRIS